MPSRSNQRPPAIGFVFVTLVVMVLGFGLLIPVLPRLITQFRGGDLAEGSHAYGALIGVFALMQFFGAPILGALSDRFGRRRIILLALTFATLDYLVMALAPSLSWLFAARALAGMTAGSMAAINAYVADVSPKERRAQNFGLMGAAFGLGFVIGPALGGVLGDINLRLPFFVAAGLNSLNLLYGAFVLPESLATENRRAFSWKRANPASAILALKRFPTLLPLLFAQWITIFARMVVQSAWVLYTGYRFNWTAREVGTSLALVGVMGVLVQGVLVRKLLPRLGEHRAIVGAMLVTVAVQAGYGFANTGWAFYALIPIGALGALAEPAVQGVISHQVPADEQGAVQGAISGLNGLAGILGPTISAWSFGYCISRSHEWKLPGVSFFLSSLLVLVALVVAAPTVRRLAPKTA